MVTIGIKTVQDRRDMGCLVLVMAELLLCLVVVPHTHFHYFCETPRLYVTFYEHMFSILDFLIQFFRGLLFSLLKITMLVYWKANLLQLKCRYTWPQFPWCWFGWPNSWLNFNPDFIFVVEERPAIIQLVFCTKFIILLGYVGFGFIGKMGDEVSWNVCKKEYAKQNDIELQESRVK